MTKCYLGSESHAESRGLAGRGPGLVVGVEVDVGQELEQRALGGLHHPVGDCRGDSGGPRRPSDSLYFALNRKWKDYDSLNLTNE